MKVQHRKHLFAMRAESSFGVAGDDHFQEVGSENLVACVSWIFVERIGLCVSAEINSLCCLRMEHASEDAHRSPDSTSFSA